ncbi:5819_t:CDS:2 [Paraglomus occultum]|uniref:5819_t:CDS:1 n=1 Tax=Paraglomus occultum TaxID=144539 RepID=A0A9N9AM65_9GLOM|nr:5819_t:CDS:2 [Paraglomus occultum]
MTSTGDLSLGSFGHHLREQFLLDRRCLSLNHGSYGTCPRTVSEELHKYQDKVEKWPDQWIRRELQAEWDKARAALAQFVNADVDEIAFIPNSVTGLNAVLKSLDCENGDKILFLSTLSESVRACLNCIKDLNNGKISLIEVDVLYPLSDEEIIKRTERIIEEEKLKPDSRIKAAVIDAISSTPDGTHAIGQIPLDMKDMDPDYFVTDCHKWLYASRGTAMLYLPHRNQENIHHAVVTEYYNKGFQLEFSWGSSQDFSSYLTIHSSLAFRNSLGGESAIQSYCNSLALLGGKLIAAILNTEVIGPEHTIKHMVNIRLSIPSNHPTFDEQKYDLLMFDKYRCYLALFKHNGWWCVRASAQIYNDLQDFGSQEKHCSRYVNCTQYHLEGADMTISIRIYLWRKESTSVVFIHIF